LETKKFVYYQENDMWVGWLEEYPDYRTQGMTLDELKENLIDIYADLTSGDIPRCANTVNWWCVEKGGAHQATEENGVRINSSWRQA